MTVSRREFLARAAAAAAVAPWVVRPPQASGMFISYNGGIKSVPWPEVARLASRLGYGGVDWGFGPIRTAGVDASKALFAELKLRPTIVNLPTTPARGDDAAFQTGLTSLAESAQLCAALGCQKMMMVLPTSSMQPKEEFWKLMRDRLAGTAEVLARSNIRLGLEFLGVLSFRTRAGTIPFIWTLNETVTFAKECGPNVGAVLDAWHWHHAGSTVADIVAAGKSRIIHVHVSDARQEPPEQVRDNGRLMPGEGIINLDGFFKALKQIGYDDGVSPEPLGRVPMDMPAEDAAKLALDTTRAVMQKAGVI